MEENFIFDEILNKINIMNNILMDIKDGTDDIEQINEFFRAIHTIKGTADLIFMTDIVDIVHKSENLLQDVRDGKLKFDSNLAHLFIEIKDYIKLIVVNTNEGFTDDENVEILKVYFNKKFDAFKTKTILIITSDILVDEIKENELSGYAIFKAKNFVEAYRILKFCTIDMLFLDIFKSEDTTMVFLNKLRENSLYRYLPIVLIVPLHYNNLRKIGQQTDAKAWLTKPLNKIKLLLIIKKILG